MPTKQRTQWWDFWVPYLATLSLFKGLVFGASPVIRRTTKPSLGIELSKAAIINGSEGPSLRFGVTTCASLSTLLEVLTVAELEGTSSGPSTSRHPPGSSPETQGPKLPDRLKLEAWDQTRQNSILHILAEIHWVLRTVVYCRCYSFCNPRVSSCLADPVSVEVKI